MDVENYLKKKLLHVYQLHDLKNDPDGIKAACQKNTKMILADSKPPLRIVARIIQDVGTSEGIQAELELEEKTHQKFDDVGGILVCPYDVNEIEPRNRKEWVARLYENHHKVIYARGSSGGAVLSLE